MNKLSLLNIDLNTLIEYKELETLNKKNWEISEYLNLKFDLNTALAFSKLYFPDFIEIEGCAILGFRFDEEVFYKWKEKYLNDNSEIERACNSYEVRDYFQNNNGIFLTVEDYDKSIIEFAKALKISWEINLKNLFPLKKYVVEVFEEDGITQITLFSTI